jgi:membrane peptidoglycan carboxypeptidase
LQSLYARIEEVPNVPLDPELAMLVLAIEDRRFRRHRGVDLRSMARAIWGLARRRPNGGGSTIDMQLVRTLTGRYGRTVGRKLTEMHFALRLRRRFGADRVLNTYAAVAYCGEGLTGFASAADYLFKQSVRECSTDEKAVLAAVLLYPVLREPTDRWRHRLGARSKRAVKLLTNLARG